MEFIRLQGSSLRFLREPLISIWTILKPYNPHTANSEHESREQLFFKIKHAKSALIVICASSVNLFI